MHDLWQGTRHTDKSAHVWLKQIPRASSNTQWSWSTSNCGNIINLKIASESLVIKHICRQRLINTSLFLFCTFLALGTINNQISELHSADNRLTRTHIVDKEGNNRYMWLGHAVNNYIVNSSLINTDRLDMEKETFWFLKEYAESVFTKSYSFQTIGTVKYTKVTFVGGGGWGVQPLALKSLIIGLMNFTSAHI